MSNYEKLTVALSVIALLFSAITWLRDWWRERTKVDVEFIHDKIKMEHKEYGPKNFLYIVPAKIFNQSKSPIVISELVISPKYARDYPCDILRSELTHCTLRGQNFGSDFPENIPASCGKLIYFCFWIDDTFEWETASLKTNKKVVPLPPESFAQINSSEFELYIAAKIKELI